MCNICYTRGVMKLFIFLASRHRVWNILSKEFCSKMLGNFLNFLVEFFKKNSGLGDHKFGAYTKNFLFTKNAPFGLKWILSIIFESVTFDISLTPPPPKCNKCYTSFFLGFPWYQLKSLLRRILSFDEKECEWKIKKM